MKVVAAGATYDPKNPSSALVAAKGKTITRARDFVGKTIALDAPNTIAQIGVLEWLEKSGIDVGDIKFTIIPFAQMLGPLAQGTVDAALVASRGGRWRSSRARSTSRTRSKRVLEEMPADVLGGTGRRRAERRRPLPERHPGGAVWANQRKNDDASAKIVAKYVPIPSRAEEMTRTRFATRLRPALAQPWLDAFAKRGLIPAGFKASELVK